VTKAVVYIPGQASRANALFLDLNQDMLSQNACPDGRVKQIIDFRTKTAAKL